MLPRLTLRLAYIQAPCAEKVYSYAGPEFGDQQGCLLIIVRALYGLKSAGASWRKHFASTLWDLGFQRCKADPDLWMRAATTIDGEEYYEYLLVYVDDLMAVSEHPLAIH